MDAFFDRLRILSEYRPLALLLAIPAGFVLLLFSCCGGCLLLFPDDEPAAARSTAEATPRAKREIPADVVAEVERIIPATEFAAPSNAAPLSAGAAELLLAAAASKNGAIEVSTGGSRGSMRVDGRPFIGRDTPAREAAQWRAALDELQSRRLVGDVHVSFGPYGSSLTYWRVTAAGYKLADTLPAAKP